MLTSIPPQVLLAIMGIAVLVVLWFGMRRLSSLEQAIKDGAQGLEDAVRLVEFKRGLHEQRLTNLDESLLDRVAADLAPDRRRFAFEQIDSLSAIQRDALFKRHPEVIEWLAEIEERAMTIEGIARGEVIFREPDGKAWTFGDVADLKSEEQDALREAKPRVWKAYRGRLFRDVIVPPEFRDRP